jgi:hypothetical protein
LTSLTATIVTMLERFDPILADLERGMEHFPPAAAKLVVTLTETRKVLESVKRSFLIRGNLPADTSAPTTAPVGRR